MSFVETGLATPDEVAAARRAIAEMVDFCLVTSREEVRALDGTTFNVVTALAPLPHPRFSRFFAQIKQDLGFGVYVPDCDTTACSFSAATQAGSDDPILNQPLLDFYAGYQVREGSNEPRVTVPINDNIDFEGGVATWIDSFAGERPFGNDLDPTLNLDILEVSFRNLSRWKVLETPQRLEVVRRIIVFQKRLAESGAFADPRSHIYYLPELYCAYFGRCYAAFMMLPPAARQAIDPDGAFDLIRARVLAYVQGELIIAEMNVFDAALALIALGHLGADVCELHPGAELHRRPSRRRRPPWALSRLRVEQDEDPDPHPGRRQRGHLGLRADGAGAGAPGDDWGGASSAASAPAFAKAGYPVRRGVSVQSLHVSGILGHPLRG